VDDQIVRSDLRIAVPAGGDRRRGGPIRVILLSTAIFSVALALILALMTLLDCLKFQTIADDILRRRTEVIVTRLHRGLATAISLGLDLRRLSTGTIVASSTPDDPHIHGVYVFSTEDRQILFSSDPTVTSGSEVPRDWLAAQAAVGSRAAWRIRRNGDLLLGEELESGFGAPVGGVVLVYALAGSEARVASMRTRLIAAAIAVSLGATLIAGAGGFYLRHRLRGTISGFADALASQQVAKPLAGRLQLPADRFRTAALAAHSELDRVEEVLGGKDGPTVAAAVAP
jgi:hypothetical protein